MKRFLKQFFSEIGCYFWWLMIKWTQLSPIKKIFDQIYFLAKIGHPSFIYLQNSNLTVNWLSSKVLGSYSWSNPMTWQNFWPSGWVFVISALTIQSHFPEGNFQAPLWHKPAKKQKVKAKLFQEEIFFVIIFTYLR